MFIYDIFAIVHYDWIVHFNVLCCQPWSFVWIFNLILAKALILLGMKECCNFLNAFFSRSSFAQCVAKTFE